MDTNKEGHFQICISVPLKNKNLDVGGSPCNTSANAILQFFKMFFSLIRNIMVMLVLLKIIKFEFVIPLINKIDSWIGFIDLTKYLFLKKFKSLNDTQD